MRATYNDSIGINKVSKVNLSYILTHWNKLEQNKIGFASYLNQYNQCTMFSLARCQLKLRVTH